jgi:hypothetical protein
VSSDLQGSDFQGRDSQSRDSQSRDFQSRIAQLPEHKRRLFEQLALRRRLAASAGPVRRPDGQRRTPLSVAQQQLWFLAQLSPGDPTYNVVQAAELQGELDEPALRTALDTLVARHEALRTVFVADGETPEQLVQPAGPAAYTVVDVPRRSGGCRPRRCIARSTSTPARCSVPAWSGCRLRITCSRSAPITASWTAGRWGC